MDDATQIIRIVVDASKAREGSDEARHHLAGIEEQAKKTGGVLEGMGQSFETLKRFAQGFIGFEIARKFVEIYKSASDSALAIEKLSQTIGINTTYLVASQYAAAQVGIRQEEMTVGFTKLSQTIGSAAQGNKVAIDAFNNLGVYLLDAQGKLRPTEVVISDVAAALLRVEDPAKRVELAVQAFGRQGAQMIPVLADLAAGSDVLATKAAAAGVVIGEEVFAQLKKMEAQSETAAARWRALVVTIGTPIATWAMEAVNKILGDILSNLDRLKQQKLEASAGIPQARSDVANLQDQIGAQQGLLKINPNNKLAQASLAGLQKRLGTAQEAENVARQQLAAQMLVSGTFAPTEPVAPGVANPADKAGGESLERRMAKLMADARIALDGSKAMAQAAMEGGDALGRLEVHTKDLTAVADAYIRSGQNVKLVVDQQTGALTTNNAAVNAQVKALDDLNNQTRIQAALKDLATKTVGLREQNAEAERELQLAGQTTNEIARQVAIHKEIAEAKQKAIPLDSQQLQNQLAAIDQQFKLKQALEDTAKSTQLWLAPFSTAIGGIQSDFTTLFTNILNGGKNVWQTFADTAKSIFIRLFAELAVIAVVRPVLAPIVQGIFSPGAAQQLGYGAGVGGAGALASIFGAGGGVSPGIQGGGGGGGFSGLGGLGNLFGSSGGGGFFGGIGQWLNTPFTGAYAGISPAAMEGVPMLSGAAGAGLTPLGALGGLASIGMGAYGLFSGRGGAANTIGSIGQIAGGALMMIPGMQPFGAALSLLSGIVPGLFGGGKEIPPAPAMAYGMGNFYDGGSGGYLYGGGSLGPGGSMVAGSTSIGTTLSGLYKQAGLTTVAGRLVGGELSSVQDSFWDGNAWQQNRPRAQTALILPGGGAGNVERLNNDSNMSQQAAAEYLMAAVFRRNVATGGVSGASDTLKQAAAAKADQPGDWTLKGIQTIIDMSAAYDRLGKAATPVKDAIDKLNTSFDSLRDFATKAGLAMQPIDDELAKQSKRLAQDFIDGLVDPLQVQLRALADQKDQALASARYVKDNFAGIFVDMGKITEVYAQKQAALVEQFYQGQLGGIEAVIQRLTYGDLSGASPVATLAGARSNYSDVLARAQGGSQTALQGLAGAAQDYVTAERGVAGSTADYYALVAQIREALQALDVGVRGGAVVPGVGPGTAGPTTADQYAALINMQAEQIKTMQADNQVLHDKLDILNSLLLRTLAK